MVKGIVMAAPASKKRRSGASDFDKLVRAAAEGTYPWKVNNLSHPHAITLLRYIFAVSGERMDILCEKLKPEAYAAAELINEATLFLNRGGKLRVLIEYPLTWRELRINPFVEAMICRGRMENFSIRYGEGLLENHQENFAVGDRKHARWEPNRQHAKAIGHFHGPEEAEPLADRFQQLWDAATEIAGRGPAPDRVHVTREVKDGLHCFRSAQITGLRLESKRVADVVERLPEAVSTLVSLELGLPTRYHSEASAEADCYDLVRD
jgi:hypothetical protein